MLPPVRCQTCGDPRVGEVAHVVRLHAAVAIDAAARAAGVDPARLGLAGASVQLGPLLDELGVFADCCRTTLLTSCRVQDFYGAPI
jgi:DNA-directed RNA polymerase subunit N (RpoN/RPB10)